MSVLEGPLLICVVLSLNQPAERAVMPSEGSNCSSMCATACLQTEVLVCIAEMSSA